MSYEFHLSDQELLMAVDGELSDKDAERVERHLTHCWACRGRRQELETSITHFVRCYHSSFENRVPPAAGPRALFRARLRQMAEESSSTADWFPFLREKRGWRMLSAGLLVLFVAALAWHVLSQHPMAGSISLIVPNPSLTPGATVTLSKPDVCRQTSPNNKNVPSALRQAVLAEYGISAARPEAYEVDYLITPALGGADDIHNLWPESIRATPWNAKVKDALENHLRALVCQGQVDLHTAQREIASNWIEAYKKYFHTDRPLTRFW